MNRETKIGLLTGLMLIVVIGVLLSNYLGRPHTVDKIAVPRQAASAYRQQLLQPPGQALVPVPAVVNTQAATTTAGTPGAAVSVRGGNGLAPSAFNGSRAPGMQAQNAAYVTTMPSVTPGQPLAAPISDATLASGALAGVQQASSSSSLRVYVVKPRDTLGHIAWEFYKSSGRDAIGRIVKANPSLLKHGSRSVLMVGEKLRIPLAAGQSSQPLMLDAVSTPGDSQNAVAGHGDLGNTTAAPQPNVSRQHYVVRPHDTLYALARRFMHTDSHAAIARLMAANHLHSVRDLRVGMALNIPAR
ncbi:MAG: LysM peptidoglycan-binding domain-containing protein [Phycisphaerales bacterium]|nr:LysM peptidoglycan-binding domain-containing protein [Phycisphaerales bacterium]